MAGRTEVALASTLVVFLYAYLNLNRWHRVLSAFTALGCWGSADSACWRPSIRPWRPASRASR